MSRMTPSPRPLAPPSLLVAAASLLLTMPAPGRGQAARSLEVHALITGLDLSSSVGESGTGFGLRAVANRSDHLGLEAQATYFPENPQGNYGQVVILAGGRVGGGGSKVRGYLTIRPGFLFLRGSAFRAYNGSSLARPVLNLGGACEYRVGKRVVLRLDFGDTVVFFGNTPIRHAGLVAPRRVGTTHNRQSTLGIGLRL